MLKDGIRYCDVCDNIINKTEKYRVVTMSPKSAEIFFETARPELIPNWTITDGGDVRLDICLTCYLSMYKEE